MARRHEIRGSRSRSLLVKNIGFPQSKGWVGNIIISKEKRQGADSEFSCKFHTISTKFKSMRTNLVRDHYIWFLNLLLQLDEFSGSKVPQNLRELSQRAIKVKIVFDRMDWNYLSFLNWRVIGLIEAHSLFS